MTELSHTGAEMSWAEPDIDYTAIRIWDLEEDPKPPTSAMAHANCSCSRKDQDGNHRVTAGSSSSSATSFMRQRSRPKYRRLQADLEALRWRLVEAEWEGGDGTTAQPRVAQEVCRAKCGTSGRGTRGNCTCRGRGSSAGAILVASPTTLAAQLRVARERTGRFAMKLNSWRCYEPPRWCLNEDLGNGPSNLDPVNLLTSEIGSMTWLHKPGLLHSKYPIFMGCQTGLTRYLPRSRGFGEHLDEMRGILRPVYGPV
ncbi:hypothetical protein QBC33DRAFT_623424 [Phialemonium atrogriseum]|uniref:Uncharacterized protein n=1 Tax=Phialemonium atrogriseum TaxID=1093897 RepID=A0AAJ0BQZ4_9PEZI|nr:uncharacterized protein QBC33DRAFT_623424 [Phialemonium atrogriseum]KAK1762864.1 hypothetical protein QBC33DRAFT_623424 [Phialemonium atrogriseum]